jgi:hypothetical protein
MRARIIGISIAAALAAGCATMTVSSHVERDVVFSEYVTYDWGPPDQYPVGDPRLDSNPFFQDHVMGAIEKQLDRKGYERALTGDPDLLIHYHASVNQKLDVYTSDTEHGYYYPYTQPQVVEYDQGTLVVDLVDARTNKVIWRGWAQDVMNGVIDNQARLEKQVDEGVSKMMLMLPRGGAALR